LLAAGLLSLSPLMAQATADNDAQLAAEITTLFRQQCSSDTYSGAILVARQGKVLTEAACGEASKRYHVPNNVDTRFNIASVGKMFTAVAIAQLAEAGKLAYEDSLDKYLDASWLPAEAASKITIAQLLAHSSGLPDITEDARAVNSSRALYRELSDMKPLVHSYQPSFQPGSRYAYSNTGYLLLGAVIEKVAGQNYYDYIRQHIYQPAGMTHSDSYPLDEPVENLAMSYTTSYQGQAHAREATFDGLLRGAPFGCGYSTLHDLLNFAQALQDGKLLKPESLQALWQNHAPSLSDSQGYGYGFELRTGATGRVIGHSGQFPGVAARFDMYRDRGMVVIALSNYDRGYPMAGKIEDMIASKQAGNTGKAGAP
jgi:CubicO group peptidase (beta-lactamase class C family)